MYSGVEKLEQPRALELKEFKVTAPQPVTKTPIDFLHWLFQSLAVFVVFIAANFVINSLMALTGYPVNDAMPLPSLFAGILVALIIGGHRVHSERADLMKEKDAIRRGELLSKIEDAVAPAQWLMSMGYYPASLGGYSVDDPQLSERMTSALWSDFNTHRSSYYDQQGVVAWKTPLVEPNGGVLVKGSATLWIEMERLREDSVLFRVRKD